MYLKCYVSRRTLWIVLFVTMFVTMYGWMFTNYHIYFLLRRPAQTKLRQSASVRGGCLVNKSASS